MEIKMKPRVIVAETPEAVAEKAAADFASLVTDTPDVWRPFHAGPSRRSDAQAVFYAVDPRALSNANSLEQALGFLGG